MVTAFAIAIKELFTIWGILYTILGTSIGYLFGFLPGLGSSIALCLLIPLTYGMQTNHALILLAGTLGGVAFGGSISAILINAPGTGTNAATALDGYALTQKGRAGEALGASATSSFLGHFIGIFALIAVIPAMSLLVLSFGPPECFSLGLAGLFLIASVSGKSLINGVISGALGLLLAMHGVNPVIGEPRFTFGQMWLWDGLPLVPVIVGLMAVGELIRLYGNDKTISLEGTVDTKGVFTGVKETFKHLPLVGVSGIIGVLIGAVPGVGGSVSSWVALAYAKSRSKKPELFGKGNIEGVIAPEACNDATEGGALMPLLSLGIPGSPSTAVLLGAFIMLGIEPGKEMLTNGLDTVFVLAFAHLLGAFVACTIGLMLAKHLIKITVIPSKILAPILIVVCLVGSFASRGRFTDVILTIIFGLLSYAMTKCNFPIVPMLLGLILGPLIERSYQTSMQLSDGSFSIFLSRPLSLVFVSIIPLTLLFLIFLSRKKRKTANVT